MNTPNGRLVRILHWCTDQAMTQALAEMDLTAAQGHIMGYLARSTAAPCPKDLEQVFQLSHPTVSGLLARLEKKEFIRMEPDPEDRRCKRIYMLPKGQECTQRMRSIIMQNEQQMVQDFSPEEKALFKNYLERAIANIGGHCCCQNKEESNQQ